MHTRDLPGDAILEHRVCRHAAVIWDRVDNITTICHTESVKFYNVNTVGALIWNLCDGRTVREIVQGMSAHYPAVSHQQIATTVSDYLEVLEMAGLVESRAGE